jgi:hypothetical protein
MSFGAATARKVRKAVVMPDKPDALSAWLSPDMPPAILFLYQQDQSGGIKLENAAQFLSGGANMASHHIQALLAVDPAIYELVPGSDYRRFLQQMAKRSERCDKKGDERSLATVPCLPNHQLPVIFAIKAKRVIHLSQEMLNHAFGGKADLPLIPLMRVRPAWKLMPTGSVLLPCSRIMRMHMNKTSPCSGAVIRASLLSKRNCSRQR